MPENETKESKPTIAFTPPKNGPFAGLLSYLVPGLGQIYQGRIIKGLVFFCCLYLLFFYGLYLGNWQNVYLYSGQGGINQPSSGIFSLISTRARFVGQMWIGAAAWPAIIQAMSYDSLEEEHQFLGKFQRRPSEMKLNEILRNNDKTPDIGWVYTVIAGVLNILVIYDAFAGPAMGYKAEPGKSKKKEPSEEATE